LPPRGGRSGLAGTTPDIGNVRTDLLGSLGCLLDVAGNLQRRCTLLFHRRRNRRCYIRHPPDGIADFLDCVDRLLGSRLDAVDLLADFTSRFRGLFGQRLHLRIDHGEAAARFSSPRRFDRCIQGQQIGLPGNGVNEFDGIAKGRLIAILLTGGEAHDCLVADRLIGRVKPAKAYAWRQGLR
jgi:hypothetical protein